MATIQPTRQATTTSTTAVRASALAAWQLVEDARYRGGAVRGLGWGQGNDRRAHRERLRLVAERVVLDRRRDRESPLG